MDTTSIAISSAALAAATQAEQRAHSAECRVIMLKPDLTNTAGRQTYASCVQFMEPRDTGTAPPYLKFGILAAVVLCIVGGVLFARKDIGWHDGPVDWGISIFIGALFSALGLYIFTGLGFLIAWCFGFVG